MSIVVVRAVGLVTIQDLGRPGHMHEGLAPGGALVPELLVAANRHASNRDDAAAIEVMGSIAIRATADVVVATDGMTARQLNEGDEMTLASNRRRVAYLAVRGGIEAPMVLGSRSTQLSAGLGGILRAGVTIARCEAPTVVRPQEPFDEEGPIRLIPGPDLDEFGPDALDVLTSQTWAVSSSSDRVGTRLEGGAIPRRHLSESTRPMVCGAIEVPGDGLPIVLGPEHPTTGGYPVIGVIATASLGRFFATGIGRAVRFVAG